MTRSQVRAQILEAILDATEAVAIEAGVGGLTVGAIAKKAGVAVGTLYNYYPNTDAILAALFKQRRAVLLPAIEAAALSKGTFETRLRDTMTKLCAAYESHVDFLRVAVQVDRIGNKIKPRDTAINDATANALETVMKQGAREKRFLASRVAPYTRMLHGSLRAMFVWRLTDDRSAPISADLLVETFLHGVS
ncbi:MAG: TetR/AcrR family transcriptional regulator [Kofleriaceae bacterium]